MDCHSTPEIAGEQHRAERSRARKSVQCRSDGKNRSQEAVEARIRWQADTRKRYLDEAIRREQFRRDFVRAHG